MEAIKKKEKITTQPGQKILYLNGLDCAHCAGKIEEAVNRIEGVEKATMDFMGKRLIIEAQDAARLTELTRQAAQIAVEIEPDVEVSYTEKKENDTVEETTTSKWKGRARFIIGAALFVCGLLLQLSQPIEFVIFAIAYVLVGGDVAWQAVKNITKGKVFDENFLMTVATIGAFCVGEYPEGVAVMLFYQVGEAFQSMAVERSRKSISTLMDIRPDYANLKMGDEIRQVAPEEVAIGDLILVKPGEKIPLDGIVRDGISALDTSALTGESLPRDVAPGSEVLSGTVNKNGLLTIEVTKEFGESTVSKILDLVQNASSKKAKTENFITKFARYYTPIVTFAAVALAVIPPLVVPGAQWGDWIYRALSFLVVSCPCALVISIPLSFFGGIGGASKQGILVKGSNYLEALTDVDTIVFDKTGTLTKGTFNVTQIAPVAEWTREELLEYAAHAEHFSTHPIARSIEQAYGNMGTQVQGENGKAVDLNRISGQEELPGYGIRVMVDEHVVLAGNAKLMQREKVAFEETKSLGSIVYLALDGVFIGSIVVADEMKDDTKSAIAKLKQMGVRQNIMLTGDSRAVGEMIAAKAGMDRAVTELLPDQKVAQLEIIDAQKPNKGKLVFVGDGVNDAPVLARADIGIAMGGVGSDAAIEAADVVLMTDEPSKIVSAIQIARKTKRIVWQNIWFALAVKVAILILAAVGIATMWEAVFGDVGVAVIAILNAMRAMQVKED